MVDVKEHNRIADEKRSPLAIARDAWLESAEGVRALGPDILRTPAYARYLQNRLETAFLAGARVQEALDVAARASVGDE